MVGSGHLARSRAVTRASSSSSPRHGHSGPCLVRPVAGLASAAGPLPREPGRRICLRPTGIGRAGGIALPTDPAGTVPVRVPGCRPPVRITLHCCRCRRPRESLPLQPPAGPGSTPSAEAGPAERDELPQSQRLSILAWRPEHTGQFLDSAVHDRLYPLWHLIAFHGLRRGESCALSWGEVDLDEGIIHITEQIVAVTYEPYEDTPKTDQIRDITLDQDTLDLLRWWKARQEAERAEALENNRPWENCGRVFTREDGTVYHPQFFSDRFERPYKKADLPPIRLHDLRHGAATIALLAGVHIKVVQKKLGHSSIKVTGDIYTSVLEEVEKEAAEATLAAVPRARKKILREHEEDDSTTEEAAEEEQTDGDEGTAAAAA
ncbi:tyrosine-type recombinase/integrase [Streptomyces sp. NBC_00829]|uniref:site-specific integrase n=1 Tax=Streptomyces sp. NBC_00829 TaxID=2903679 RepID=UPI00386EFA56|nr:tyrosine-type recombinase/integrase [Streptomyces sp. NBC_00829]